MESNVPPGDQCDVMVAVKCEGSETMDSYKNYAHCEAADPGTVDSELSTHSVKTECDMDFVHIKKEYCDSDLEYEGDVAHCTGEFQVKTEENGCIGYFGSDTVRDIKCQIGENNVSACLSLRSANRNVSDVAHCAEQKTEDMTLRYECFADTMGSDSIEDKCQISEVNVKCSRKGHDLEISDSQMINAVTNVQTQATIKPIYISDNSFSVDAGDFASFCNEKLHLKSEEIDLGCDIIEYSPNLGKYSMMSIDTEESDGTDLEKPHICNICDKKFSLKTALKYHMLAHTDKRPHKCKICEKKFTSKSRLNQHMLTHTDERSHKCNICKKKFSVKSRLNQHMLIHTGKKTHICNLCKKKFTQKSTLNQHMFTHTREKLHKCNVCKMEFAQKANLNKHTLTHTGEKVHKCTVCEKKFTQKSHLNQHMLIHTGEKHYKCTVCDKTFSRVDHLNRHMVTHTGDKLYICTICEKKFAQKVHLNKHMLTHVKKSKYVNFVEK